MPCDRLIIESTFGLPIYRFLSSEDARHRIVGFARECLDSGITPVFIGYPLGRGQEVAHVLCHAGVPTAVHGAIARLMPVYTASGFTFPGWFPYNAKETEGKALVVVPGFRAHLEASGKNTTARLCLGMGGNRQCAQPVRRRGTDRLFRSRRFR